MRFQRGNVMSAPKWYETKQQPPRRFRFRSSSSEKIYETLLYADGVTSCSCPGWTRRVDVNGARLCVHTRLVKTGNAESDPLFIPEVPDMIIGYPTQIYTTEDYKPDAPIGVRLRSISKEPQPKPITPRRKFSFE